MSYSRSAALTILLPKPTLSAMLARVYSCAVIGLDGVVVEVEVDTGQGLPKIIIVGLPDTAAPRARSPSPLIFNWSAP